MKRVVALVLIIVMILGALIVGAAALLRTDGIRSGTWGQAKTNEPEPVESDRPSETAPSPELQEFYDQPLKWSDCDDRQCALIDVPLDYANPSGRTISLALLKVAAGRPSERVGSLVVNPGGPGGSGTDYADNASLAFGEPIRDHFDIVGFDPRGTGQSTTVDCLTDKELDEFMAFDPAPDNPAEVQGFAGWSIRLGKGCAEKSGDLAAHVSTVEAARDMDVIRAVLGEKKLTYFGASYGTKLGATYADLFPGRSGRLVLDGAVDVSLSAHDASVQQAEGFQVALTAYVDACVARGDCFLGRTRAAGLNRIEQLLDEVDAKPMRVGSRELKAGNAFYGLVAPLYNQEYWSILDLALENAINGDADRLLWLSDIYASRAEDGTYENNSSEAIYAINCLDDPFSLPIDKIPAEFPAFEKASPTFGRVFAWGLYGCAGLSVQPPAKRPPLTAKGADPLLVIGTTRDPATPMRWAVALAKQLEPAILVKRDGDGHTAYNMGNDCIDNVVEDYLIRGKVPSGPVDCPA